MSTGRKNGVMWRTHIGYDRYNIRAHASIPETTKERKTKDEWRKKERYTWGPIKRQVQSVFITSRKSVPPQYKYHHKITERRACRSTGTIIRLYYSTARVWYSPSASSPSLADDVHDHQFFGDIFDLLVRFQRDEGTFHFLADRPSVEEQKTCT